jgi:hypothetical protein
VSEVSMNAIVACADCGWTASANTGDLVVTEKDTMTQQCTDHQVVPV